MRRPSLSTPGLAELCHLIRCCLFLLPRYLQATEVPLDLALLPYLKQRAHRYHPHHAFILQFVTTNVKSGAQKAVGCNSSFRLHLFKSKTLPRISCCFGASLVMSHSHTSYPWRGTSAEVWLPFVFRNLGTLQYQPLACDSTIASTCSLDWLHAPG